MATGRGNQLTKQVGEYLVAAELCRRGFIATTFTGNVPYYDIVASSSHGRTALLQVKTINAGDWQFDIRRFADFRLTGKKQLFKKMLPPTISNLICVFVLLDAHGQDKFFIFPWRRLQIILVNGYRDFLAAHGGKRPRKSESFHSIVQPWQVAKYENNWQVIETRLK